jgi:hypothetical protein
MIPNCKRSKQSSACRLETFSLTGWTRSWFGMTVRHGVACVRKGKGSDRIARSMRLRNDLIDEKYVIIGDMIRSEQGLRAANPLTSIRLRNEIAATAKSRIWQNLFSALLHFMRPKAEHPNLPRPVVKVIPSISNFSLNRP